MVHVVEKSFDVCVYYIVNLPSHYVCTHALECHMTASVWSEAVHIYRCTPYLLSQETSGSPQLTE